MSAENTQETTTEVCSGTGSKLGDLKASILSDFDKMKVLFNGTSKKAARESRTLSLKIRKDLAAFRKISCIEEI